MLKRTLDCVFALFFLTFLSPLFLSIASAVFLTSRGPVIFRQIRLGRDQIPFVIYKFRTLRDGSGSGALIDSVLQNDPRVTSVGRFLRKTRLDELPQLFNVLRGDMSLVGPRPNTPEIVEVRVREHPAYTGRFSVTPGLTGLGHVRVRREITSADARKRLRLDMFYIKHKSLWLDLKILLWTIGVVLRREGI